MGFLINFMAKLGGVSKLWGFLDGYKTKVAGVGAMLAGLAGLTAQIVVLIESKDASAVFAFAKGLPTDQSLMMFLGGLGALGLGHKAEKAAEAAAPAPEQPK